MNKADSKIFIVDDDAESRSCISLLLKSVGYNVESFISVQELLENADHPGPGCILLDVFLGEETGLELQSKIEMPYGLVAKANIWYLVYGRGGTPHVTRVAQIVEAEVKPEEFTRPPKFELEAFWESWCREYESQPPFQARERVAPEALSLLLEYVGDRARGQVARSLPPDADGWVTLDLPFDSFVTARTRLLGLGRAVEVLEPESLRKSLVDSAEQIVKLYKK